MPCHHPDGLHMKLESADQSTDTDQSPSVAHAGESHTPKTSEMKQRSFGGIYSTYLLDLGQLTRDIFYRLTWCFSAAVVMCGKTFTVTQQDDEESSTTTAKLSNASY